MLSILRGSGTQHLLPQEALIEGSWGACDSILQGMSGCGSSEESRKAPKWVQNGGTKCA